MGKYIEIQDKDGTRKAFLTPGDKTSASKGDGVKDCYVDIRLNGESSLDFLLPLTNEKWKYITPECRIIIDEREYVILRPDAIDVERTQDNKVWGKVMAQESWVLLGKKHVTVSNDPDNPDPADLQVSVISGGPSKGGYPQGSAGSALSYLLYGSGWTLGTVDVSGVHDLETEKISLLENIKKVQEIWGGFLVWDSMNKKVSLRDEVKWQNYTGYQVRYSKNLKNITRTQNNDIVTRLYPFGEDDLDISSVNNGKKYLENFSYTDGLYVGVYQNQDLATPEELKEKAQKVLDKLSQPRYTYRIKAVDLRTLPEYSHEKFTLGDMVDVVDPDIGTDRIRVQRHKYNVFMPWQCEFEVGEPEQRLTVKLKDSFDASKFVREALRPNPSISNLLKSFVNTFTTKINGAKGDYSLVDGVSTWWDRDSNGQRTGKIVRITPGGIGISNNAGQNFKTAMTGDGILANVIICSALYALSSGDGYTKLIDDGLHVYDDNNAERVHVGRWLDGVQRYGLKVVAADGQTTLLDDRGLPQIWEITPGADNVDDIYPYIFNFYIPPEVREIKKALLRFRLLAFRAYEKAAKSKNLGTLSISKNTTGQSSTTTTEENYHTHTYGEKTCNFSFGYNTRTTSPGGTDGHVHSYQDKSVDDIVLPIDTTWSGYPHSHKMEHTHKIDHSHTIGSHDHELDFGIWTSTIATGVRIRINGIDRTSALGGPFSSSQTRLDIVKYLNIGQLNTIELSSTRLGRIDPSVFIYAMTTLI